MKQKIIPLTGIAFITSDVTEKSECEIKLGNVVMPSGMPHPYGGITLYYGAKMNTTKSLRIAFLEANKRKEKLLTINLDVAVPTNEGTLLLLKDLPKAEFMHIERVEKSIADLIQKNYIKFKNEKKQVVPDVSSIRLLTMAISNDIDFIGYLHGRPKFKNISVIAYPVTEDNGEKSTRATLFNPSMIDFNELKHPIYSGLKFAIDEQVLAQVTVKKETKVRAA